MTGARPDVAGLCAALGLHEAARTHRAARAMQDGRRWATRSIVRRDAGGQDGTDLAGPGPGRDGEVDGVSGRSVAIVIGCCGIVLALAGAMVAFQTAAWSEGRTWGAVVFVLGLAMCMAFVFADRPRDKR